MPAASDAAGGAVNSHEATTSLSKTAVKASGLVETIVSGARVRTRPINGTILGLFDKGHRFRVYCQMNTPHNGYWGRTVYKGHLAWISARLYGIVQGSIPCCR